MDLKALRNDRLPNAGLPTKTFLIMKLIAVLTFVACLHASAGGYAQKITLSRKNAPLEAIFKDIKQQTGYNFIYNYDWLQDTRPVTIQVRDASLNQVLEICFKDQPLTYAILDKTVALKRKPAPATLAPPQAALLDIHGRVLDENGKPVSGVTVTIRGTKKATATDENGEFTLPSTEGKATLVFTSANMEPFEVNVNNQAELVVNLKTKVSALQDVVINKGYYTTSQRLNTGSVGKVTNEVFDHQPVANPIIALEGRLTGVQITQLSGVPGGGVTVNIRGLNSLRTAPGVNDPLYVIDGVPFTSTSLTSPYTSGGILQGASPLNSINPADIGSMEILKDADATAIYGSRGSNGVVLITTKKGTTGKTRFMVNAYTGFGKVASKLKLLDTKQYLQMRHEAFTNDGAVPGTRDYDLNGTWDTTRNTDWQKTLLGGTSHTTDIEASISGGNAGTRFLLQAGNHQE
jgi:TonB-dependent SusC/RagA subfamily outer membrane receptor